MALLVSVGDLQTHIYNEVVQEITRGNEDLTLKAIKAGIAEAKMYLSKYDLPKLFGTDDTDPVVDDENLENKVKDLAAWHLIKLSNPNIDLTLFRTAYEDAISFFKDVQKGMADSTDWPLRPAEENVFIPGGVTASSNRRRSNHW